MLSSFPRRYGLWIAAALLLAFVALKVYAGVVLQNTINPSAEIFNDGREVLLTGPLRCSEDGNTALRVIFTQRSTGAVAECQIVFDCSTTLKEWKVLAHTRGLQQFTPGPTVAVALGQARSRGVTEDAI